MTIDEFSGGADLASESGAAAGATLEAKVPATLKEVAERAGVSPTTASLFFNGRENVCSEPTAVRLRKAAAQLGYDPASRSRRRARAAAEDPTRPSLHRETAISDPNTVAKPERPVQDFVGFRGIRPPYEGIYVLGVCIPRDAVQLESTRSDVARAHTNAFLEQLWRGLSTATDVEDFRILQYPRRIRDSATIEPFLRESHANGLLMLAHTGDPRPAQLAAAGMAVVLIGPLDEIPDGCGAVFALESDTVHLALQHLWQWNHRRIAYLTGPSGWGAGAQDDMFRWRRERYVAWMQLRQHYDPALVFSGRDTNDYLVEIAQAVRTMLGQIDPPTAIFCASDFIAIAACEAAISLGKSVPGDLSIVGVSNSLQGAENRPGITSVEIPYEQVAAQSVVQLTRILEGVSPTACRMAIAVTNLVVRESTGPAKAESA